MTDKWIDLRKEMPKGSNRVLLKVRFPCYFDQARGDVAIVFIEDKYVTGEDGGVVFRQLIDLTNDERHWKWKLNKKDKNHYEDFNSWAIIKQNLDVPDDYHYYAKDYKSTFKTFEQELPMTGTSIIVQLELEGSLETNGDEIWLMREEKLYMCPEMQSPLVIDLSKKDIDWKWKRLF